MVDDLLVGGSQDADGAPAIVGLDPDTGVDRLDDPGRPAHPAADADERVAGAVDLLPARSARAGRTWPPASRSSTARVSRASPAVVGLGPRSRRRHPAGRPRGRRAARAWRSRTTPSWSRDRVGATRSGGTVTATDLVSGDTRWTWTTPAPASSSRRRPRARTSAPGCRRTATRSWSPSTATPGSSPTTGAWCATSRSDRRRGCSRPAPASSSRAPGRRRTCTRARCCSPDGTEVPVDETAGWLAVDDGSAAGRAVHGRRAVGTFPTGLSGRSARTGERALAPRGVRRRRPCCSTGPSTSRRRPPCTRSTPPPGDVLWRTPLDHLAQQLSTDGQYLLVPGRGVTLRGVLAARRARWRGARTSSDEVAGDRSTVLRGRLPVGLARPAPVRVDGQRLRRGPGLTMAPGRACAHRRAGRGRRPARADARPTALRRGCAGTRGWVAGAVAAVVLRAARRAVVARRPGARHGWSTSPTCPASWTRCRTRRACCGRGRARSARSSPSDPAGRWAVGADYHVGGVDLRGIDPDTGDGPVVRAVLARRRAAAGRSLRVPVGLGALHHGCRRARRGGLRRGGLPGGVRRDRDPAPRARPGGPAPSSRRRPCRPGRCGPRPAGTWCVATPAARRRRRGAVDLTATDPATGCGAVAADDPGGARGPRGRLGDACPRSRPTCRDRRPGAPDRQRARVAVRRRRGARRRRHRRDEAGPSWPASGTVVWSAWQDVAVPAGVLVTRAGARVAVGELPARLSVDDGTRARRRAARPAGRRARRRRPRRPRRRHGRRALARRRHHRRPAARRRRRARRARARRRRPRRPHGRGPLVRARRAPSPVYLGTDGSLVVVVTRDRRCCGLVGLTDGRPRSQRRPRPAGRRRPGRPSTRSTSTPAGCSSGSATGPGSCSAERVACHSRVWTVHPGMA